MWEGWLEFIPESGSGAAISAVESRQPERAHLAYWATGLSAVYAEGALERALNPITVRTQVVEAPVTEAQLVQFIVTAVATRQPQRAR